MWHNQLVRAVQPPQVNLTTLLYAAIRWAVPFLNNLTPHSVTDQDTGSRLTDLPTKFIRAPQIACRPQIVVYTSGVTHQSTDYLSRALLRTGTGSHIVVRIAHILAHKLRRWEHY